MTSLYRPRLVTLLLALAVALPSALLVTAALPDGPQVIKTAACGDSRDVSRDNTTGCGTEDGALKGVTAAADALVNPAVLAMIAIAPIACLVGAASLMFGSRRGLTIIGAALGTLVFLISIRGIVA